MFIDLGQFSFKIIIKKCRGECRVFPSSDENDCNEKNFCEEWEGAAAAMIFAAFVGGIAWLLLIGALVGGRNKRERAWKGITALLLVHGTNRYSTLI